MSELLPCPFCGGEAELTGFNAPEYWVWCPSCKASTDAHTGKMNAIEAWNTRAVVRCRDCKFWMEYEQEYEPRLGYCREHDREEVPNSYFCAWGVSK